MVRHVPAEQIHDEARVRDDLAVHHEHLRVEHIEGEIPRVDGAGVRGRDRRTRGSHDNLILLGRGVYQREHHVVGLFGEGVLDVVAAVFVGGHDAEAVAAARRHVS